MTKTKALLVVCVLLAFALVLMPKQAPYALIDLVETNSNVEDQQYLTFAQTTATHGKGTLVVTNRTIATMVTPAHESLNADMETGLLVITEFPDQQAVERALNDRQAWRSDHDQQLRTYAAKPAGAVQSFIGAALPFVRGLFRDVTVPMSHESDLIEQLTRNADILEGATTGGVYHSVWDRIIEMRKDEPVWMLNFLEFYDQADYGDDPHGVAPSEPISGEAAYTRYGQGMIGILGAIGGRVGFSSRADPTLANADENAWDQIVIAVYPSVTAMMAMLVHPEYQAAHVHRPAGLKRTRLMATFPIESPIETEN
jgi:uncharacterized protein (DUF1330 family)